MASRGTRFNNAGHPACCPRPTLSRIPCGGPCVTRISLVESGIVHAIQRMEDIPNNHLGCVKPCLNHGINYQPQLVSRISSTNTMMDSNLPQLSEFIFMTYTVGLFIHLFQTIFPSYRAEYPKKTRTTKNPRENLGMYFTSKPL